MYQNSGILTEAKKAKFQPNIFLLLLFILILFITAYLLPQIILGNIFERIQFPGEAWEIAFLFLNIITILAGILYCTKIEKRSLLSMGFTKVKIGRNYGIGFFIGIIFLSIIICGNLLFGAVTIKSGYITPMVILFLFGYVIQGMSEEVALRGCLMVSAANRVLIPIAITINSLFFAIPHYIFSGGQLLFTMNVFFVGILFSIYLLQTDNIWGISGLHTGFNIAARCLFNSNSDGISVFYVTSNLPGKELIGGNDYGITSGLMCTICIVIFLLVLFVKGKINSTKNNVA